MLRLYNTLTRKKENFVPIDEKRVTMYSCGPTVYNFAHIGNLRTYVFTDLLRRVLKYDGFKLKGVMNITDVGHLLSDGDEGEDKMETASRKQGKSPEEIAAFYTAAFLTDLKRLNIGLPEILAKATDHIGDMLEYVGVLVEKGYAYQTADAVYFDISKFPEYGKLSRLKLDDQIAGARVKVNESKRNPADFALWKIAEPNHIMKWDSPYGKGYPGWHIECSAMSRKYLGEVFDIHTGGVDHIPVHHENEIAQNEARAGKKTVNYWLHGEFMCVDGGKMSKSLGNTYTIDNLVERGYRPLAFRYFCLNAHYRKKLNFTFESMDAAQTAYLRLLDLLYKHKNSSAEISPDTLNGYTEKFNAAIDDDLNAPLALGILWTMLKEPFSRKIYETALVFDRVLGLGLDKPEPLKEEKTEQAEVPQEVAALVLERSEARKNRDWAKSDELREKIDALGFKVIDSKDGCRVEKK
jgi:cysteinyl-tRNA synthetase